ncbi:hypothetical protein OROMI_030746 [Orobanche minor]
MANLVNLILQSPDSEFNIKEITESFSKLACNAHTICDSELRPLGTGLYPVISVINHSCLPNSVLVFEGKMAVLRAMQHIPKDTEKLNPRVGFVIILFTNVSFCFDGKLTRHIIDLLKVLISYIDVAGSTVTRQKALKEQYFFTCTCCRCVKLGQRDDIQESAILEGYRCKDNKCNGFLLRDSEK